MSSKRTFTIDLDEARQPATERVAACSDLMGVAKVVENALQQHFADPLFVSQVDIEQDIHRETKIKITIVAAPAGAVVDTVGRFKGF